MGFDDMSQYELDAWLHAIELIYKPTRRGLIPGKVRDRASSTMVAAGERLDALPGAQAAKDIIARALEGTLALTFQPALGSAAGGSVLEAYAKRHAHVQSYDDIRKLALRDCDAMVPPKFGYTAGSAVQGAVTALAVTGTEVATTVTGGTTAAVAIGAVAADTVASMAIMGRTIGAVATRYGYDVRLPEEELFAMGVLSLGTAGSLTAKTQAISALSRLTQAMMRRATWKQLNDHLLVQAIAKVYELLGLHLTQKKLAQTLPVVGVALNAALSAQLTDQTFRRAQAVYRLRSLSETYGIDPREWVTPSESSSFRAAAGGDEPVVDVMEVLESEIGAKAPNADGVRS